MENKSPKPLNAEVVTGKDTTKSDSEVVANTDTQQAEAKVSETKQVEKKPSGHLSAGQYPRMGSFLERLVAYIIDYFILMFLGSILGFFVALPFGFVGGVMGNMSDSASTGVISGISSMMQLFVFGISLFVGVIYYVYFYTKKGQTPGKMVMKLKVVRADDLNYLSAGMVILRQTIGMWVNGLLFYLGYLWYFMSPKRQTWADSIASSLVVKTDDSGQIYMDGQETYPKKPLNTFLPCGCFGLLFIAFVVILFSGIIALTSAVMNSGSLQGDNPNLNEIYMDENWQPGDPSGSEFNFNFDDLEGMDYYGETGDNMGQFETLPGTPGIGEVPDFENMTEEEFTKYLEEQLKLELGR